MKKKILLNLVMGISLIATPALLLASCSAQASDVELVITAKDAIGDISDEDIKDGSVTLATAQKLFNIEASDFNNVKAKLKSGNVAAGQTNQVVLTAKDGFIFESGANTLDSKVFTLSNAPIKITVKDVPNNVLVEEVTASSIGLGTLQKLFNNVDASNFNNVNAKLKNGNVGVNQTNQVILTAKEGFIFESGASSLESVEFNLFKQLGMTKKDATVDIKVTEVNAGSIKLGTVQKLFNNVNVSNFINVTPSLKNGNVAAGQTNQIVLTAQRGLIFGNGVDTLESNVFTLSNIKMSITAKDAPADIKVSEVNTGSITLATVQKLFNIGASDFNNVTASLKNGNVGAGQTNQIVLTAQRGLIFGNGVDTLESNVFTLSNIKMSITAKDAPADIKVSEVNTGSITLATVQKLFNIGASDFNNVTASLKNGNVGAGQTNQIVLTAKEGFIFESGANTLESNVFTLAIIKITITAKDVPDHVFVEEVTASSIGLGTLQKLFNNVDASNFNNVNAKLKNGNVGVNQTNQVILTAKEGFIFESGASSLESVEFTLFKKLAITAKPESASGAILVEEILGISITLTTIQKIFNISESDFNNVTVSLKNPNVVAGEYNQVVLTAKPGFIFENSTNTLESFQFKAFNKLTVTLKNGVNPGDVKI